MRSFTRVSIVAFAFAFTLPAPPVCADTVTLTNGAAIDGIVTGRHEGFVILTIGNVGTMKIPENEVKKIEKNPRTGYLDPEKGRKKVKKIPKIPEKKKPEDADETEGEGASTEPSDVDQGETLDPAVEKVIRDLASNLTQQKTSKRTRAERRLAEFGDAAIPELVQLADHSFDRTRVAVFRLLKKSKDSRVIEPAVIGLSDEDKFVRKLAWETLRNVSGKSYAFPWDSESSSKRKKARKKWADWATAQEEESKKDSEGDKPRSKSTKKAD